VTVGPLSETDGVRVLRATGDLDARSVPPLLEQVPALVGGAGAVVLDLSSVPFFDSSGVRLLDRVARTCGRSGVPFRAVAPPGTPARRVLDLVGLGPLLASDDLTTALRTVEEPR
jgi:anti-anti-sigma factor